jgi:hypothetical protein
VSRLRALAPWELALLALLLAWALAPIVWLLVESLRHDYTLTGADGPIPGDQLQYLAWVRDAGEHGLAANLFELRPSGHVFLHPLFTPSGLASRIGLPIPLAYWLWKPVAALALGAGALVWVKRLLPGQDGAQAAAAALVLFSFSPLSAIILWGDLGSAATRAQTYTSAGEMFVAGELWGYAQTAIAIGLMPVVVLLVERAARGRSAGALAWAAAAGAAVSWLHPWQGVTLALVLGGLAAWPGQSRRRRALWLVPLAGVAAPLGYYALLAHYNVAWELASRQNEVGHPPVDAVALALAPLAVPAAFGLRRLRDDVAERALLLWIAASLVAVAALNAFPAHFLAGLSFPLAVLAVRGASRVRAPVALAAGAVALATLPGMAYVARELHRVYDLPVQQLYLVRGDADALAYVRDGAPPGGVLASPRLATSVPSQTGRAVWEGHPSWTPDYEVRLRAAQQLFTGALAPGPARELVRASGARVLVAGCGAGADLRPLLGPLVGHTRRFGCATVYELRRTG